MGVTTHGLNQFRDWMYGSTITPPQYIGEGLGTTAFAAADVALANEVYPTTSRNVTAMNSAGRIIVFRNTQGAAEGSTATYAEHGLFNAVSGGSCWTRQDHPGLSSDSVTIKENIIGLEVGSYLP